MKPGKKNLIVMKDKDKDVLLQSIIDSCVEYAGDSYEDFAKEVIDSLRKYKLVDYGKASPMIYENELRTALTHFRNDKEEYIVNASPWEINRGDVYNEVYYRGDKMAQFAGNLSLILFSRIDKETEEMISKNVQEIIFNINDGIRYNVKNIATLNQYLKKSGKFDQLAVSVWKDALSKNLGDEDTYTIRAICEEEQSSISNLSQLITLINETSNKNSLTQISLEIGDDILEIYNITPEREYLCRDLFERFALPVNNKLDVVVNEQDEIELD